MMDNKGKGRIGLSTAINYFTIHGYTVSLPINDTQWYDLIIEKNDVFKTVQCKCTGTDEGSVSLRSCGGTRGRAYHNLLDDKGLDFLFCVDKYLNMFLIPVDDIRDAGVRTTIYLRVTKSKYQTHGIVTSNYLVTL